MTGVSFKRFRLGADSLRIVGVIVVAGVVGYVGTGLGLQGSDVAALASPTSVPPTPTVARAVTFTPAPTLTGTPIGSGEAAVTPEPAGTATLAVASSTVQPTVSPNPTATPTRKPVPTPVIYVVQSGDTIEGIGKKFGVAESAIVQANKLADPNSLRLGQKLVIPK